MEKILKHPATWVVLALVADRLYLKQRGIIAGSLVKPMPIQVRSSRG